MAGLCQCGCGVETSIPLKSSRKRNEIAGVPHKYIKGHHSRDPMHPQYRGLQRITKDGYVELRMPDNQSASAHGYVLEHVFVVESALGHKLPDGAMVHHVNGDTTDNRRENLVVCQDAAFHKLLHRRSRALSGCGHADWISCVVCKQWGAPGSMYFIRGSSGRHARCHAQHTAYHAKQTAATALRCAAMRTLSKPRRTDRPSQPESIGPQGGSVM